MKLLFGSKKTTAAVVAAVLVAASVATVTFAGDGDEEGGGGQSVPGVPYSGDPSEQSLPVGAEGYEPIVTNSGTYDPTILTKFIPGVSFVPTQGTGLFNDLVQYPIDQCLSPDTTGGGTYAELDASVELPDGARIKKVIAYGRDSYAGSDPNIGVQLWRTTETFGLFFGPPSVSSTVVSNFNTTGVTAEFSVSSADNLAEETGIRTTFSGFPFFLFSTEHRFHSIHVLMTNAASTNHRLCGVEVQYQVPAVSAGTATVFYAISPIRAFDSRFAAYAPLNGVLAPNTSKVVSIKDGHDAGGVVNLLDAIPSGATAVTYNITVTGPTGPNFIAVTPGDAASFTASAINFNGTTDVANAATVAIAADRTIKIWGGDQSGSAHVIIDITGFYAPLPNMGN